MRKLPISEGDVFGILTAVQSIKTAKKERHWLFNCACGKQQAIRVSSVVAGHTHSCGCTKRRVEGQCVKCKRGMPLPEFVHSATFNISGQCRECSLEAHREKKLPRANLMFLSIKGRARRRGMSFSLTQSDIISQLNAQDWKCLKTGIPFDLTFGNGRKPFGPTIDRIENSRGYEADNIQIVCNLYNFCKNEFTDDDVMKFVRALAAKETDGPSTLKEAA